MAQEHKFQIGQWFKKDGRDFKIVFISPSPGEFLGQKYLCIYESDGEYYSRWYRDNDIPDDDRHARALFEIDRAHGNVLISSIFEKISPDFQDAYRAMVAYMREHKEEL